MTSPGFEVLRRTSLAASDAWSRLTEWERHGDVIPLTTVRVDAATPPERAHFVARTGVGPLGINDVMQVTYWQPPTSTESGLARVVKVGRVVVGWAVLTVTPQDGGCEIRWQESVQLRGTPWPLTRLVDRIAGFGFGRVVDKLLAAGPGRPGGRAQETRSAEA